MLRCKSRIEFVPYAQHNQWDLADILDDLRASDREEFALFGFDPQEYGGQVWAVASFSMPDAYIVYAEGKPVFAFGAAQHTPGVCQLWGFGTKRTVKILPALTRFILEEFGPRLFLFGARRVQVLVPLNSRHSFRWLTEHLGLRVESIMPHYCTDGSPMAQLVFTKRDYEEYVQSTQYLRNTESEFASGQGGGSPD